MQPSSKPKRWLRRMSSMVDPLFQTYAAEQHYDQKATQAVGTSQPLGKAEGLMTTRQTTGKIGIPFVAYTSTSNNTAPSSPPSVPEGSVTLRQATQAVGAPVTGATSSPHTAKVQESPEGAEGSATSQQGTRASISGAPPPNVPIVSVSPRRLTQAVGPPTVGGTSSPHTTGAPKILEGTDSSTTSEPVEEGTRISPMFPSLMTLQDSLTSRQATLGARTSEAEFTKTSEGSSTPQHAAQPADPYPAMASMEDPEMEDVVIAIIGPTGSGKSTFIGVASGLDDQGVNHELEPHTSRVDAVRFLHQKSGRYVVLVDTPGFSDTLISGRDVPDMISSWLSESYKDKLFSGILYFHRITDNRMPGVPLRNLGLFRKLCGDDALDKVWLVTTMWDEVRPDVGEERLATLEKGKRFIDQGARIACCRSDESPKKIIQDMIDQEEVTRKPTPQREPTKKVPTGIEVGQELYTLTEKWASLLLRMNNERKSASPDPRVLAELQIEYNELWDRSGDGLRQMQELGSWWLGTLANSVPFRRRGSKPMD